MEADWEIEILVVSLEESIWIRKALERKDTQSNQREDELVRQNKKCKTVPLASSKNDVEMGEHWKNFDKWAKNIKREGLE